MFITQLTKFLVILIAFNCLLSAPIPFLDDILTLANADIRTAPPPETLIPDAPAQAPVNNPPPLTTAKEEETVMAPIQAALVEAIEEVKKDATGNDNIQAPPGEINGTPKDAANDEPEKKDDIVTGTPKAAPDTAIDETTKKDEIVTGPIPGTTVESSDKKDEIVNDTSPSTTTTQSPPATSTLEAVPDITKPETPTASQTHVAPPTDILDVPPKQDDKAVPDITKPETPTASQTHVAPPTDILDVPPKQDDKAVPDITKPETPTASQTPVAPPKDILDVPPKQDDKAVPDITKPETPTASQILVVPPKDILDVPPKQDDIKSTPSDQNQPVTIKPDAPATVTVVDKKENAIIEDAQNNSQPTENAPNPAISGNTENVSDPLQGSLLDTTSKASNVKDSESNVINENTEAKKITSPLNGGIRAAAAADIPTGIKEDSTVVQGNENVSSSKNVGSSPDTKTNSGNTTSNWNSNTQSESPPTSQLSIGAIIGIAAFVGIALVVGAVTSYRFSSASNKAFQLENGNKKDLEVVSTSPLPMDSSIDMNEQDNSSIIDGYTSKDETKNFETSARYTIESEQTIISEVISFEENFANEVSPIEEHDYFEDENLDLKELGASVPHDSTDFKAKKWAENAKKIAQMDNSDHRFSESSFASFESIQSE